MGFPKNADSTDIMEKSDKANYKKIKSILNGTLQAFSIFVAIYTQSFP